VKSLFRIKAAGIPLLLFCAALFLVLRSRASVQIQIGRNFFGSDNSITGLTPADANGAIGPQHFVEFINGAFVVYNKTNGERVLGITDAQFWTNAGVVISSDDSVSEPRIIYDPTVQRWFASEVDFNSTVDDPTASANDFLLAVSDTAEPTGTWHGVSFTADPDTGLFADFPTLGVDSNAVYLAGDMFSGGENPVGSSLWSIPKSDLLMNVIPAVTTNATFFGVMTYADRGEVLQPATCIDGSSAGDILAAGDVLMDDTFIASKVLNGDATNATLAPATPIKVDDYTYPIDPTQPDGTATLADSDARISARVITAGGILFAVQNVEVNNRAAIRWYRITLTNEMVLESGTITNSDLDLFYPSVAVTANGIMLICCNGCSINVPVSSYAFVGQTVNDVTTFSDPIVLQAGTVGDYHDPLELTGQAIESRWGDYSTTSLDPCDPSRFWTIQMLPLDSETWITRITEMLVVPQLAITATDTNVNLSWPVFAAKYRLQTTVDLSQTNWTLVPQTPSTNGDQISVSLPVSANQQFFRLAEP